MKPLDDEPVWVQTLHALYKKGMKDDGFDKHGYTELSRQIAIAEEIDQEPVEVAKALRGMERVNLVDSVSSSNRRGYTLTEKGFNVADSRSSRRYEQKLENGRNKRQHDVNRAVGFLTIGLLVIGLIEATISALTGMNASLWEVNAVLGVGVIVIVILGFLLYQSGLLSEWSDNNDGEMR